MKEATTNHFGEQAKAMIPTPWGNFLMYAFAANKEDWMPHFALVHESFDAQKGPTFVRIHSECITGDLLGSKRCDCGDQLHNALSVAAQKGGVVIYLRQEGRGIGIINKLKAYQLQDQGLNTIDANVHLKLPIDARDYEVAEKMLQSLGIRQIHLLTNNPTKIAALENSAIEVVSRVPIIIQPIAENQQYLKTKQDDMGHLLGAKV